MAALEGLGRKVDGARLRATTDIGARAETDLGSTVRCFTAKQRAAIAARDGGCIIPGCTVPARWSEVHHVIPWQQNGPTNIDNGVLLCWFHHHTINTSGWKIRMINGRPQVRGPLLWDPSQTWRPAHSHRANSPSPEPHWRT